jgi:hypothetical protein
MLKQGGLFVKREFPGWVLPTPVAAQILHYAIQPAFEARVIAQAIKGEVSLQQGFLYQFARDFFLADQS